MTIQSDMALMAAGSYWDVRIPNVDNASNNRAPTPSGYKVLTDYDQPGSGPNASSGFSARVYQSIATGEIVISFGGTEFNTSSFGLYADFLSGNIPLSVGEAGAQAIEAARLYQRVKADPKWQACRGGVTPAQSQCRVSLKAADRRYRINSCLRTFLKGYGQIRHKKCRAPRVSVASVSRVVMTYEMCA